MKRLSVYLLTAIVAQSIPLFPIRSAPPKSPEASFVSNRKPATGNAKAIYVKGYTKRDGAVVKAHWRRAQSH
jgi:hypothetical protein